jgi:DNA-directed RNA polymerase subunit RPC12/RpoP
VGARLKGEVVSLQCARCGWSNELPLRVTEQSAVIPCTHCAASIYWHRCEHCGLCYLGEATPACPSCDDSELDPIEFD